MSNGKKWTEDEIRELSSGKYTAKQFMTKCGKTKDQVRHKCVKLGIDLPNHDSGRREWSDEDRGLVRSGQYSIDELCKKLNRTRSSILHELNKQKVDEGVSINKNRWDDDEIELLKSGLSLADLSKRINRPVEVIRQKRNRLGLGEPVNYWTEEELLDLSSGQMNVYELMDKYGRNIGSIYSKCRELGIKLPRKQWTQFNKDFFKTFTRETSYCLGLYWADGNIHKYTGENYVFSIACKDKGHLEKIRDVMESAHNIRENSGNGSRELIISSKEIYMDLISLGSSERKSLTAIFPPVLPDEFLYDFLRGYIDGDGSVHYKGDYYPEVSLVGTKMFLDEVIKKINLPRYSYLQNCLKTGNTITRSLSYNGLYAKELLSRLYKGATLYLDRKYQIYLETLNWVPGRVSKESREYFSFYEKTYLNR